MPSGKYKKLQKHAWKLQQNYFRLQLDLIGRLDMKPNPLRQTDFFFDKIIIGSSLEAMVTAFKYEIPIFGDINNKPLPYYYIPADLDLSPYIAKTLEPSLHI